MMRFNNHNELDHWLKNGKFTLISGHSDNLLPHESTAQHNNLLVDLHNLGYNFMPVTGKWNGYAAEPSVMVMNMDPAHAGQLAKKYGQMATIQSHQGAHKEVSHHPSYTAKSGVGSGHEIGDHLQDNYSEIKLADGTPAKFHLKV